MYPKVKIFSKLVIISWTKALILFVNFLIYNSYIDIWAFCGDFVDIETLFSAKRFLTSFGCSNFSFKDHKSLINHDFRGLYLVNYAIKNFEKLSFIILVACNPRLEAPLLNSRIRKNYLINNFFFKIYSIGFGFSMLNYPVISLGNSLNYLLSLYEGKCNFFREIFLARSFSLGYINFQTKWKPFFLLGSSILIRKDVNSIFVNLFLFLQRIKLNPWHSFGVLSNCLGRISVFEADFFQV